MTRSAISPRFAMRTLLNTSYLQWDVSVLLRRIFVALRLQCLQRGYERRPCVPRVDDVVDVPSTSGDVGMRKLLSIFLDLCFCRSRFVFAFGDFLAKQNLHRSLRSHHGDLGRRPRDVEVAADVFRAHDVVGAAIRFARDYGKLGHGRLAVGIEQLRPMFDDTAMFLRNAREKTRYVLEGDERDIERIAKTYKACRL